MKKFWTEFKAFISRGNIMNMAVGVIVGAAFSAIVTALTNNIIRPFINWILATISGGDGLSSVFTFLKPAYMEDGVTIDLANSIYIDWGAFITAIIDFFIIAFTIFMIMKLLMGAQGFIKKSISDLPTRAERKQLKKDGVNVKNYDELIKATAELREKNKPAPKELPPTQEELLTDILAELKKQNEPKVEEKQVVEEKPKKKKTTKKA
jgi:large conductance mechanosensitive channel